MSSVAHDQFTRRKMKEISVKQSLDWHSIYQSPAKVVWPFTNTTLFFFSSSLECTHTNLQRIHLYRAPLWPIHQHPTRYPIYPYVHSSRPALLNDQSSHQSQKETPIQPLQPSRRTYLDLPSFLWGYYQFFPFCLFFSVCTMFVLVLQYLCVSSSEQARDSWKRW